jgi:ribosome-associated protein
VSGAKGGLVIESIDKAMLAAKVAQEKKGFNLSVLDVEGKCSYADAIVIASATSERQAEAIAEAIVAALREADGARPLTHEGHGGWSLIDFGDVVVHVFLEDTRSYYDLDVLWSDARRVPVPAAIAPVVEATTPSPLAARRRRWN